MKLSLKSFLNFSLGATDGEIGTIREMYFDDERWAVRHIVVETGGWLSGRVVLVSPRALTKIDPNEAVYGTKMSMQQIKESPDIDTEMPVSRQEAAKSGDLYPSLAYMGMAGAGILIPSVPVVKSEHQKTEAMMLTGDRHLRSSKEITGYQIHATDGEIGSVEDFIIDSMNWHIEFLVVETGSWFSGKRIILATDRIKDISWSTSRIIVDVSVEQVAGSPEFDEKYPVNVVYEKNLRDYYGRLVL